MKNSTKNNLKSAVKDNLAVPCDLQTEILGIWTDAAADIDVDLANYVSDTILDLFDDLFQWLERRKPKDYRLIMQELEQIADWNYSQRPYILVSIKERREHVKAIRNFLQQKIVPLLM